MLYILGAASELFVMIGNIFSEEPKPLLIPLLWKFTTFAGFMKIGSSVGGVIGSTVGMISIFLHTSAEEERIEIRERKQSAAKQSTEEKKKHINRVENARSLKNKANKIYDDIKMQNSELEKMRVQAVKSDNSSLAAAFSEIEKIYKLNEKITRIADDELNNLN